MPAFTGTSTTVGRLTRFGKILVLQATVIIGKALEGFTSTTEAATKDWLAFWGIYAEAGKLGTEQPEWIKQIYMVCILYAYAVKKPNPASSSMFPPSPTCCASREFGRCVSAASFAMIGSTFSLNFLIHSERNFMYSAALLVMLVMFLCTEVRLVPSEEWEAGRTVNSGYS